MDWTEAVEIVVARDGHARWRVLCADDHPDREAWRRRAVGRAGGVPADAVPAATAPGPAASAGIREKLLAIRRDRARAEACPHRDPCGCAMARCHLVGRMVAVPDCVACLDSGGAGPPR